MFQSIARYDILVNKFLLNEIKDINSDEATYNRHRDALEQVLLIATSIVEGYCGRTFVNTTFTDELHTPIDEHCLWVNNYPIITITKMEIWNESTDAYVEESSDNYTVINNRYIYYPAKGKESEALYLNFSLTESNPYSVNLTYDAGYDTTGWNTYNMWATFGVPANLEYATAQIAYLIWSKGRIDQGWLGLVSMSTGHENITRQTFVKSFPDDVILILNQYVRAPDLSV